MVENLVVAFDDDIRTTGISSRWFGLWLGHSPAERAG
jgi:hypothetical protein